MERFFIRLYDWLHHRHWTVLLCTIGLTVLMAALAGKLELREDIASFLPTNGSNQRLTDVYKQLSMGDEIFVSLSVRHSMDEDERTAILTEAADLFTQKLDSLAGRRLIKKIVCHTDESQALDIANFITANLPFFLEDGDYVRMDSMLKAKNYHAIFEGDRDLMLSPMGMGIEENLLADPFHFATPVLERLRGLQSSNRYRMTDGYLFTNDGKHVILFVESANGGSETAENALLAKAFDDVAHAMPANIDVSYFGAPLVAVTNASQIKTDTLKSVSIACTVILLMLLLFFRDLRPLVYVVVSVGFGALFGLSLIYLLQGHVSSIALGAGSVIVGIAINYALHYVIHLQHHPDPRSVLGDIASPMIVGNITTVGAFLSLLLISAQAMRDMGLFAALALIGTILFVLIVLPHWAKTGRSTRLHILIEGKMESSPDKNPWLVVGCAVATIALSFFCNDVGFETDFNKINYMTPAQRTALAQMKGNTTLGDKSIYHISQGSTLEAALRNYEQVRPDLQRLHTQGAIVSYTDLWSFLPSDSLQRIKITKWNKFCSKYRQQLLDITLREGKSCGFSADAFTPFTAMLNQTYTPMPLDRFKPLSDVLMKESMIRDAGGVSLITLIYANPHKTATIYHTLDNKTHSFVFDMQSVMGRMVDVLQDDFNLVLYVCGFLVFFFLWYSFGRIELSGIAFLPMAISWIWILGIMGLLGMKFNIVNIILSTFIFGLGDDYTIFIVDGLMYEYAYRKKMLSSYKTSVLLSALFMLVGIGSLIIARHPAVRSLAEVTIVGMACVVLIAFIVPPLIFRWMVYKKGEPRLTPVTWKNLGLTVYCFLVFLLGSLLLTAYGFWLLKIHRATDARKLRFHKALCCISRFVVHHIPGVRYRISGYDAKAFETPGVIICNHQSHIDLMYLLMMSPRIVVLTNEWVWNCIFYGRIIRYADFLPVANGIENCIEPLQELVQRGYSIAVFPEGTRSVDGTIGRFHRGAFYLAEKLGCDILPVVFHGIGHVLPKTEFLLRSGTVTVKCLPRIRCGSADFGQGYAEQSKGVRHWFQREYAALAREEENAPYFLQDVLCSYRYKGVEAEREAWHALRNVGKVEQLIASLPKGAHVIMHPCGIGAVTLLTALVRKDITVCGVESDGDKLCMARNCRLVPSNLTYISTAEFGKRPSSGNDVTVNLDEK